ncbi:MAG: TraR/DksA C4-type zinc finger protein [Phycisphaerae bacterium]
MHTSGEVCPEGDQPGERAAQAVHISELRFITAALRDVDAALARARNGLYGVCGDCERPIAKARLEANPAASRCTACQTKAEWSAR